MLGCCKPPHRDPLTSKLKRRKKHLWKVRPRANEGSKAQDTSGLPRETQHRQGRLGQEIRAFICMSGKPGLLSE